MLVIAMLPAALAVALFASTLLWAPPRVRERRSLKS